MTTLKIHGCSRLRGTVPIQGSKGSTQLLLPATIALPGKYLLRNLPCITDRAYLEAILCHLGAQIERVAKDTLFVDSTELTAVDIPSDLAGRTAASFLFAGALLGRAGEAQIGGRGGDQIGARPIDWHLQVLKKMGASVSATDHSWSLNVKKLTGTKFGFPKSTVHGTANALLAAARASGTTHLTNVAREPEIDDLILFLKIVGVPVARFGASDIFVEGRPSHSLSHSQFAVMPDRIDAGVFAVAAIIGKGPVTLRPVRQRDLQLLVDLAGIAGAKCKWTSHHSDGCLSIERFVPAVVDLHVCSAPFPGIATDWGPAIQVLMACTEGSHTFHELVFSKRLTHIEELLKVGVRATFFIPSASDNDYFFPQTEIQHPFHAIRIDGGAPLRGGKVYARDIRAGSALVLAGLAASGTTLVHGADQIARGHERFASRLRSLGASVVASQPNGVH